MKSMKNEENDKQQLWEIYDVDDFIDAKDNQGDWRVGYIIDKNQLTKTYKVRFDGWHMKYDEFYKFTSVKLKEFRSTVIGYTGQKQNSGIRAGWKFTNQSHQQKLNDFKKFIEQGPQNKSAHVINQILRGHNFLYIDFLMTCCFSTEQSLREVFEYFKLNISFICSYLKHYDTSFNQFYRSIQFPNESHLVNSQSAYAWSFYQILDTAYIITGSYNRLNGFFKENSDLIRKILNLPLTTNVRRGYQIFIMKQFLLNDGLNIIQDLLKVKLPQTKSLIPFLFLKSLTSLYMGLSFVLSTNDKESLMPYFVQITIKNLERLGDKELKDFHKRNATDLLDQLCQLHEGSVNERQILEWATNAELNLCLKMIKCPYFEKKLKGINGLMELIQRKKQTITLEFITNWFYQNKLFQILFIENDNPELIKKSSEFARHLHNTENLPKDIIFLIWQARLGKHQTSIQQIYQFLSGVPLRTKDSTLTLELFQRIAKVPQKDWDDDYVKLIKDYTINALGLILPGENVPHSYGYTILYRQLLAKQDEKSFINFALILQRFQKTQFLSNFVVSCFENVQKDHKSDIHISILLRIIREQLVSISPQINIIDILINDLLRSSESQAKKLQQRFQLFSTALKITQSYVGLQAFKNLWNTYLYSAGRKCFLEWASKKKDEGKFTINVRISPDIRSDIFNELWPLGDESKFKTMQEDEALFFIQLFKSSNLLSKNLKKINGLIFVEKVQFNGYEKIEKAFTCIQTPIVAQMLADLIVILHMNLQVDLQNQRQAMISGLLANISNRMKQSLKQKDLWSIKKQLMLTEKLILREEEIFPINKFPSKFCIIKDLTVIHQQTQEEKVFRFNVNSSFYQFKKEVALQFDIPIKKCKLYIKDEQVIIDTYFKPLLECNFGTNFQLRQPNEDESLIKTILNQQLQHLFELLGYSEIQKDVWKIVSQLPLSQSSLQKVQNSRSPWVQVWSESIYRQLYMLRVVEKMNEEWWKMFVNEGGISLVLDKLKGIESKTQTQRQYFLVVVNIINKGVEMASQQTNLPGNTFTCLLKCLEQMLQMTQTISNLTLSLEEKIIQRIFQIGNKMSTIKKPINQLINLQSSVEFIKAGLIMNKQSIRRQFLNRLNQLKDFDTEAKQKMLDLFLNKLFQFAIHFPYTQKLFQYFHFTSSLLRKIQKIYIQKYIEQRNPQLINYLFKLIREEKNQQNIDKVNFLLYGYLTLMTNLIAFGTLQQKKSILQYTLYDCLFSEQKSKCKSRSSYLASLQIIRNLLRDQNTMPLIIQCLGNFHKNGTWRSRRIDDWTVVETEKLKSSTGYVGLKNLGCICYMNSFLQQIYMIPKFRQSILQCQNLHYDPKFEEDDLLFQLKQMFLSLSYTEKRYYNPKQFCNAFKDYEGKPTNVHEQMDIDEFSGILFDRIENQIKDTEHGKIVKDLFGGIFSNEIVCKGCPHFSETQESFLSIGLTVKNKRDIYQSLDAMIKGDTLEGDNAYFCQRCNKKVSAVKRVCLKRLPDHLIIALKRFQFDYQTMTKLKINDYCQFPMDLNLKEYSQESLRRKEKPNNIDEEELKPDYYYEYTLKGVAIHLGHADSGHYYSFIQERGENGNWFQFNDTFVRHFDPKKLAEEAFGGEISHIDLKQKIKNAYLLIYDRNIKMTPKPKQPEPDFIEFPVYSQIRQNLIVENKLQKIQSILFSDEYSKFLNLIINDIPQYPPEKAQQLLKFCILAYLTIIVRFKDQTATFTFLKRLKPLIQKYHRVIEWTLLAFSSLSTLQQFFKNNPSRDIRKLFANWLSSLCIAASQQTQKIFTNCLLLYINTTNENPIDICTIFYNILKYSGIADHLVAQGLVGRLMQNLIRKEKRKFNSIQELKVMEQSLIGRQIIVQKSKFQLSRKPKTDVQNGYFWAIIMEIIKISEAKKINLNQYLGNIQTDCLHIPSTRIYKILEETKNKFHINKFCDYLCFLSHKNEKTTDDLLNMVYKGIHQFESKRYRQFFVLFKKLINIQDDLQPKRILGYKNIIKALKQNQKYIFDCDVIQQWIIKLLKKNTLLQEQIRKDQQTVKYLASLALKKNPSEESIRKNSTYTQTMVNKLHGIQLPKSKKSYVQLSKQKQEFFLALMKKTESIPDPWESDQDISQVQINQGSMVSYFNFRENLQFTEMKVEDMFLGRITIANKKMKPLNLWKDDELLTKPHKVNIEGPSSHPNSDKTTEMDPDEEQEILSDS